MRNAVWTPFLLLMAFAAYAEEKIELPILDKIHFVGNKVTRASILRQEMLIKEGHPYTPQQIEKSRRALMNMGLFKSVRIEPTHEQGKHILLVTVDERFYILPIPLLDYRPSFLADETANNYSYGGEVRFDNLFGLNQRLKVSYRERKYEEDIEPEVKLAELHYIYPHITGTPYRIELKLGAQETSIREYSGSVLTSDTSQNEQYGSIVLSRWFNPNGISEGWRAGVGVSATTTDYGEIFGISPYRNHDEYALVGSIGYHMVNDYPYHREGYEYSYSMQLADKIFTSDHEYFRNKFSYRRYIPLKNLDANFNTQLLVGMATGKEPTYSLGGSTSLRGYDSDIVYGNLLLQGNFEYHHHISGYRQLRGVLFMDMANVWPEINEIDRLELLNCIGIGARWRVQSFVDVNLRVDFAYNLDTQGSKTYFATTGSF